MKLRYLEVKDYLPLFQICFI